MTNSKGSNESVGDFDPAKEVQKTWIALVFRIFQRMNEKMEMPFFLSVPQVISNLAFLISTCDSENTAGLRQEFVPISGQHITNIKTRQLIEVTLEFVRNWNTSLFSLSKPGHYHSSRRAICHPKYAKAYTFNTFKTLRRFEVELKIFEGSGEVLNWLSTSLKMSTIEKNVLNIWSDEFLNAPGLEKKSKQFSIITKSAKKLDDVAMTRKEQHEEKKPPILVWASHMTASIHPDFFDAINTFNVNGVDCFKIHGSPKTKISICVGKYDWNTLILPTASKDLQLVVIYGMSTASNTSLNLDSMRDTMSSFLKAAPCLIRPRGTATSSDSKSDSKSGSKSSSKVSGSDSVRNVYIPTWNTQFFRATNVAEHMLASLNMNSIFYTGGFGDLAVPDAEPSASPHPRRISHIQHYNIMTLVNSPHTSISIEPTASSEMASTTSARTSATLSSKDQIHQENITLPFVTILWDSGRSMPVYMGKVCNNPHDTSKKTTTAMNKQKHCVIC